MSPEIIAIDHVRLNFNTDNLFVLNLCLGFIMFGVALHLRPRNFVEIFRQPKIAIVGIISQFILLPLFTFLFIYLVRPYPSLALGMILVAACPGGNVSNFISLLAKGNPALSVSLTAFATVAAVIITPLNFSFWGNLYGPTSVLLHDIEVSTSKMIEVVFFLLGIPLIAGMLFNRFFPKTTQKITKGISILSIVIFIGFLVIAFAANFDHFMHFINLIFILVLAHNVLALATGYFFSKAMKMNEQNARTISIETGIQNAGLGLVLIFNFFPDLGGMAIIAAWWGIWHILAGLGIAWYWSRKKTAGAKLMGAQ
jgi:bile acid:Na+ symporter, BASS family